ncbi:1-acyl-sn-glycerol-3-phosphate acyltransferase alpha-like [Diadema setosum]|uniref:1-acyl-sn-glycerol-3-phosphate acyltransferase alpha-like n=1 Tax=Diadema setosum TaxID=31175 RepID=UPI003B3A0549
MTWEGDKMDEDSRGIGTEPSSVTHASRVIVGLVVAFVFVVLRSRSVRFHLKYFAFGGIYFFFGLITIPIQLFNPCDPKSTRVPRLLVQRVQAPLFGISVTARGLENYPKGSFVIVCNHQSSLDCIGVMEIWPERCVILMKKILKYAGPFGLGAVLAGTIFVDRSNQKSAKETLKHAVETIHRKNYRILVFPEGTRKLSSKANLTDPMLPFKKGAFNLAVLAQVPIVPVVFSSQKHIVDFKSHTFTSGHYTAKVLPPVSTEGLTLDDVQELSDKVRDQMIDTFRQLEEDTTNKND